MGAGGRLAALAACIVVVWALPGCSCGRKTRGGGAEDGGAPTPDAAPDTTLPARIDRNDCPGPLSNDVASALAAGGAVDPAMRWLYPYGGTVFPTGLLAPVLQWDSASTGTEAVRLHLSSTDYDYVGCFAGSDPPRLAIPQDVWDEALSMNHGAGDALVAELTTIGGGAVSGPIREHWTIALGSLKGTVYYNTYDSPLAGGVGAVMRIKPGADGPEAFLSTSGTPGLGPCMSCHVLSVNGLTMIASKHGYPFGPYESYSYDLGSTPGPNPPPVTSALDEAAFAALYPDGSRFIRNGSPSGTSDFPFPAGPGNVPGMRGPRDSGLFDVWTGDRLSAPGWDGVIEYAKMPMFSPDGTKIVFNHHEASDGHTLAVMEFDAGTNTFSGYRVLYEDAEAYPGWPMFTPDGRSVVFVRNNNAKHASWEPGSEGDLYLVDVATGNLIELATANGRDGAGTYLPQGGRDEHQQFFPTMSPVAAGGYFWLFFTSRRTYGNTMTGDSDSPSSKKIWVAAIDIFAELGADPSHPAFYLLGQELDSGNIRAFATLEPCRDDGEPCETGIDCCSGFCTDGVCGPPQECAHVDEHCETTADCCDDDVECVNGFCATILI